MATANPFDLLGDDDNDDPSQLIATQQQKISAKKLAAAAPAKLPSRPIPPQQSVREARVGEARVEVVGAEDSKLDVTIGPYETYEDALFGYKATFESFVGIRDDIATSQVKLFGDHLQDLEQNLPLDDIYKSKSVVAAPIRVIQLLYNAGELQEVHSGPRGSKIRYCWPLGYEIPH